MGEIVWAEDLPALREKAQQEHEARLVREATERARFEAEQTISPRTRPQP